MGDALPRETENTVYRYLIAISKLRLGILTEQGEGCSFSSSSLIYLLCLELGSLAATQSDPGPGPQRCLFIYLSIYLFFKFI